MATNTNKVNVQTVFIKSLIDTKAKVSVFLLNGIKLSGTIIQQDDETIIMGGSSGPQLVYKHAASTIAPALNGNH